MLWLLDADDCRFDAFDVLQERAIGILRAGNGNGGGTGGMTASESRAAAMARKMAKR